MEPRRRFRFLKALSEGSFGKVYLAEMVTGDNFSTVVAIKLLHGKWLGHEEIVMRSRDEARLLGLLRHQNIIRVEDLSSINGQCAVIMEYLEGVDLKTMSTFFTERGELFPRRAALEIAGGIASALDAAYNHRPLQGGKPLRVIHRDIKPSNVMITAAGEVKVLDFGTARANFEDREAKTQALAFGSQAYMAPERMMGDPDTPAADVFSLGVTLWEILSGERFGKIYIREGRYQTALEQRVAQIDLAALPSDLGERIRELLLQMMDYDATARPTSSEVVEKLEDLYELAPDTSLKRLCRQNVLEAMAARDPGEAAADPLTGTTLVEDRSSAFVRTAGQHTWSDEAASGSSGDLGSSASLAPPAQAAEEPSSGAWLQDAQVEPLEEAPPADPPQPEEASPPPVADADPEAEGESNANETLIPPMEALPAVDSAEPPDPQISFDIPPDLEAPSGSQEAASEADAALEESVEGAPPSSDLAPDSATWDGDAVAIQGPVVGEPADSKPSQEPAPRPPPAPPEEEPERSSSGGKIGILFAVVGLLGVVIVGGGLVAWFAYGRLRSPDTVEVQIPEPVDPVVPPSAPVASDHVGDVVLRIVPAGGGDVSIVNSASRYKESWSGLGDRTLSGVPVGTYRTKIDTADGSRRSTFEVIEGQTCTYSFDLGSGADEWRSDGCL
ncbi:MAG: protein kinase [Pseudomonadota bacterium]